ncbi:hypothetical protein Godav_011412, partial [Gossypium davidsonii]|nr:hypothetical protein [Gossypium davidsonii]MBA0672846.1 hypothetical protein [Gossypium klotzschianum]
MGGVSETYKVVEGRIDELESMRVKLTDYVLEALSFKADNVTIDDQIEKLTEKNDALKDMVMTLKGQVVELKGELIICKFALGNRMLASGLKQHSMGVPKSKYFEGRGITKLTVAMVEVESFIKLDPTKDKFESFKTKETGHSGGYHEEDGNGNGGNGKNGGNKKPLNGKWKPNKKLKGPIKCFFYDGPYMVRDCPKKSTFSAIEGDDEPDRASMRPNLIMCSIEVKKVKECYTLNLTRFTGSESR